MDHSSRAMGFGSKVGFDCTKKLREDSQGMADVIELSPEIKQKVDALWRAWGCNKSNVPPQS